MKTELELDAYEYGYGIGYEAGQADMGILAEKILDVLAEVRILLEDDYPDTALNIVEQLEQTIHDDFGV